MKSFSCALLTAAALLAVTSCGDDPDITESESMVRPVKLLTLSTASDLETSRYPAVVSAGRFSELSFQVGGLIEDMAVVDAEEVAAGDVIARLDRRDFESRVNSTRAQFENAETEYQRALSLADRDLVAQTVLNERQSRRDVTRAELDTAEKALEDSTLVAPFGGLVARVAVRERETVTAGQTIAALIDMKTLEVTVDLPANIVARSQEFENRSSNVILDAASDLAIPATFKEADLLADTASQTYGVTFTFEPPESLTILPGMNATLELSAARIADAGAAGRKAVPLSAVTSDGESTYVWVVDPDTMTVSRRDVTLADGVGEYAIVTEGLADGDVIATAGASFLADGMQVRPWGD